MMAAITITTTVDMTAITVAVMETGMADPGVATVVPTWVAGAACGGHNPA